MTQKSLILNEMLKRGGQITTWELMSLHVSQYQARILELRRAGHNISEGEPIQGQKKNFLYRLIPSVEKNGKTFTQDASRRSDNTRSAPRELFKQDQLGREVPQIKP